MKEVLQPWPKYKRIKPRNNSKSYPPAPSNAQWRMPSADTSNSAVRSGSLELFLQLASLKGSMARKRQLGHQKLWASPWYFLSFQKNCNGWNPTLELKWNHNMLIWPYPCHLFERMLARKFSQKQLYFVIGSVRNLFVYDYVQSSFKIIVMEY